jgi:hypothetical protein
MALWITLRCPPQKRRKSKMPHTPGPWQYEVYRGDLIVGNSAPGVEALVCRLRDNWTMLSYHVGESQAEQVVSDARLIAAAPDLLRASQDAMAFLGVTRQAAQIVTALRDAIDKALVGRGMCTPRGASAGAAPDSPPPEGRKA